MVASALLFHEKTKEDKHVESKLLPRVDEGSTPSSSTIKQVILFENYLFFFALDLIPYSKTLIKVYAYQMAEMYLI